MPGDICMERAYPCPLEGRLVEGLLGGGGTFRDRAGAHDPGQAQRQRNTSLTLQCATPAGCSRVGCIRNRPAVHGNWNHRFMSYSPLPFRPLPCRWRKKTQKTRETVMAKYLCSSTTSAARSRWMTHRWTSGPRRGQRPPHMQFMQDFADRLQASDEYIDG